VPLDVLRRTTFFGYGVSHFIGGDHVDRIPGTDLGTVLATDAAIQIDIAPGLQAGVLLARDLVDAIDGTDLETGLAARASIGVDDRENLGDDLTRFSGQ
jgi:hypothetical protein